LAVIMGLDIGGANTKVCWLQSERGRVLQAAGDSVYHEMWRDLEGLKNVLSKLRTFGLREKGSRPDGVALTMTAELCDCFETKAQGVLTILRQVEEIFADVPVYVWTRRENFARPDEIRKDPLAAAAANYLASAAALARSSLLDGPAIFADMGSTTTDILPVAPGLVLAAGRTDTERLLSGELLYTGVLRTAVHSIITEAWLDASCCQVAREHFAISADAYRVLGLISEEEYNVQTPDGKGRDQEACTRRLARVVASEPEVLGLKNIYLLARLLTERQTGQIVDNILRVISRKDVPWPERLIYTGQGSFILREAARRLRLRATPWWEMIPGGKPEPAMTGFAVAWLLAEKWSEKISK